MRRREASRLDFKASYSELLVPFLGRSSLASSWIKPAPSGNKPVVLINMIFPLSHSPFFLLEERGSCLLYDNYQMAVSMVSFLSDLSIFKIDCSLFKHCPTITHFLNQGWDLSHRQDYLHPLLHLWLLLQPAQQYTRLHRSEGRRHW